jgi:hypothetical protein
MRGSHVTETFLYSFGCRFSSAGVRGASVSMRQHASAYVSIRQHTCRSPFYRGIVILLRMPVQQWRSWRGMLQRLLRQFLYFSTSKASKRSTKAARLFTRLPSSRAVVVCLAFLAGVWAWLVFVGPRTANDAITVAAPSASVFVLLY